MRVARRAVCQQEAILSFRTRAQLAPNNMHVLVDSSGPRTAQPLFDARSCIFGAFFTDLDHVSKMACCIGAQHRNVSSELANHPLEAATLRAKRASFGKLGAGAQLEHVGDQRQLYGDSRAHQATSA